MNRRRITEDFNSQSVGAKILWSVMAGIGLGIGFLIVKRVDQELEKKRG